MPPLRSGFGWLIVFLLLAIASLPGASGASVDSPGLKIRWAGERPSPAVAGQEFAGRLELAAGKAGRLESLEISGQGWAVRAVDGVPTGLLTRGDRRFVTFRAVPDDPSQPLIVRAAFEGRTIVRPLRVGAAALAKKKLHFADAAGPRISGTSLSRGQGGRIQGGQIFSFMGDFRYTRGDGVVMGADGMEVKVWDDDSPGGPSELIWSGTTDANGHFEGAVNWDDCDFGCDFPDLYVEVTATGPGVEVQEDDVLETTYSWQSGITDNFTGAFINFGTISPGAADEQGAAHIFTSVKRAHRFAAERAGMFAPPVEVLWPEFDGNSSFYNDFFEEIHIAVSSQWNEITHVHEFGHHLHNSFGNYLEPDYENGICDTPDPSHCYWCPEGVGEGWQEGFAYWYAMLVVEGFPSDYGQTAWSAANFTGIHGYDGVGICEEVDPDQAYPDGRTEGYVAALLRDMQDGANDDHDGDATADCEVDAMSIGYDEILTVFRDDDPTDIGMFISKFRTRYPNIHDQDLWSTARNVGPTFAFPLPAPIVLSQPAGCDLVRPGATASFSVTANGSLLKYQWKRNGLTLTNGSGYSGVTTPTITISPVTAIQAGRYECVVTTCDGTVSTTSAGAYLTVMAEAPAPRSHLSWGENSASQVGNGNAVEPQPTGSYTQLKNLVQAEGGRSFSVALKSDGTVWTWGHTGNCELGNGGFPVNVPSPAQINITDVDQIAAGFSHVAALRHGRVWTWGANFYGQIGDSTRDWRCVPTLSMFPDCIVEVACGQHFTLALDAEGSVWACGYGAQGEMGNGTNTILNVKPAMIPGLSDVIAIDAGFNHAYALKRDGTVWSWGMNSFGQLGTGVGGGSTVPVQVAGLTSVRAIAASNLNGYAIRNNGEVYAWGRGDVGMIGNGSAAGQWAPALIPGLNNPKAIESGDGMWTMALMQDGTLRAWGYNAANVLGTGAPNGTLRFSHEPVLNVFAATGLGAGYSTAHVIGQLTGAVGVDPPAETETALPLAMALRVSPVPSKANTTLAFDLPASGVVSLAIYDVAGKRVQTVVKAWHPAGRHVIRWDGRLREGGEMPAGMYFARLERGHETMTRRIILVR